MTKFFKNPCNIYIALLTFYSMQGTLIPTGGSILSQVILLITMLMGLYYTIKVFFLPRKPVYFSGLNLFFLVLVIYGVILLLSSHNYVVQAKTYDNEVPNYYYLKNLFLSFPNIYTFYYFSIKRYLTEELLKKWVIVFFCVAVFRFFDYRLTAMQIALLNGVDAEEVTNNMGYVFAALIPAVVVFKRNPRIQLALLIISLFFIIIGMKRGAILVGVVSLLYYLYFNYRFNKTISRTKVILFSLLIIIAGLYITQYMMTTSEYFNYRIESTRSGSTSGRNELYAHFWNHFKHEQNLFRFLLGNGANATLGIGENYAHNDWLEIAINQGVFGLFVYVFYWGCFLKTIRCIRFNKTAKLVLSLTFISFFIKTIFSMSYTGYSMMPCTVFGYYLAHCMEKD